MIWIFLILATSALSMTLALSKLGYWLWRWPLYKVFGGWGWMLGRCHYCTAHYTAFLVIVLAEPVILGSFWLDLFLGWLALITASSALVGLIWQHAIHFEPGEHPLDQP